VLTLGLAVAAAAQQSEPARKQARAVRVAPGSIVVDGRPDEVAWTRFRPSPISFRKNLSRAARRPIAWR
jgi:hypothetical protein